jgi:uncharacterized phage protein (TIGR02220 family)
MGNKEFLMETLGAESYFAVNKKLVKKLGILKAFTLAILVDADKYHAKNESHMDGYFFITIESFTELTGMKKDQQQRVFTELEKLNLIEVKKMGLPAKRYFKINYDNIISLLNDTANKFSENPQTGERENRKQDIGKSATIKPKYIKPKYIKPKDNNNNIMSSKKLDTAVENEKKKNNELDEIAIKILNYFIEVSGRKFRPVEGNLKFIRARLKEGYTEDDFKKVIDFKVSEWGKNPKMHRYIRCKTLFNSENFDGYLQESNASDSVEMLEAEIFGDIKKKRW